MTGDAYLFGRLGGFSGGVSLDEPLLPASSLTRNTRNTRKCLLLLFAPARSPALRAAAASAYHGEGGDCGRLAAAASVRPAAGPRRGQKQVPCERRTPLHGREELPVLEGRPGEAEYLPRKCAYAGLTAGRTLGLDTGVHGVALAPRRVRGRPRCAGDFIISAIVSLAFRNSSSWSRSLVSSSLRVITPRSIAMRAPPNSSLARRSSTVCAAGQRSVTSRCRASRSTLASLTRSAVLRSNGTRRQGAPKIPRQKRQRRI